MNKRWALVSVLALAMAGCSHHKKMEKEEDNEAGGEVKMSLNEVPAAVQETLRKEAAGATIGNVDKETGKNGEIVYETDVKKGGKNYEIRVAPDGKLISNKVEEDEEDEKGEKK